MTTNPLWEGLNLAWELGYLIAIPAVIFSFGGAYLDKTMGTSPLYLLIGIALAVLLSGFSVYRKTKHLIESTQKKDSPPSK